MPSHVSFWCVRTACAAAILCLLFPTASLAATLRIAGTGAALGTMRILADTFIESRPDVSIEIPSSLGSGGGIKAVIAGAIDIGLIPKVLDIDS